MALQDYATLGCSVNGQQHMELTSISKATESGQMEIYSLARGLAGFSPGQGKCTIELGFNVPVGGYVVNFEEFAASGELVTLQTWLGPMSYSGTGKIITANVNQSTGSATAGTASFIGQLKPMK